MKKGSFLYSGSVSGLLENAKGCVWNCTVPVSYTHLDVYKRQILLSLSNSTGSATTNSLASRLSLVFSVSSTAFQSLSLIHIYKAGTKKMFASFAKLKKID